MRKILFTAFVVSFTLLAASVAYAAYQACPSSGNTDCVGTNNPDRLDGTDIGSAFYGYDGADVIMPGNGDDYVDAGNGADLIVEAERGQQSGNDADTVFGGDGNDTIDIADGDTSAVDEAYCGTGNDIVYKDSTDTASSNCEAVITF